MTTVHTPDAAARTGADAGEPSEYLLVLPGVLRDGPAPTPETELPEPHQVLPGDRLRRLQVRRRLLREQMLAVMFLFLVLAITVGVLAMQWLGSGGAAPVSLSSVVSAILGGPA